LPNFVSFAASIAELRYPAEKNRILSHSHTASVTHPAYLMCWEPKLSLQNSDY